MARTITGYDTHVNGAYAKHTLYLLISDVPSNIQADTAGRAAWQPIAEVGGPIGPELDWRSGLGAWSGITFSLLNDYDSTAGSTGDNSFERLNDLRSWGALSAGYVTHLLNAGSGDTQLYLAAGSAWGSLDSVKVFTGFLRQVSQSDHGPMVYEVGPKRETYLKAPFLNRLFSETSGEANYDLRAVGVRLPRNLEEKGSTVPIIVGRPKFAESIAPHKTPSFDVVSVGHGLVLCFSDDRFVTDKTDDPQLYAPAGASGDAMPIEIRDFDNDIQYEWIDAGDPERINFSAGISGSFVGFTDNVGSTGEGKAGNGYLLITRTLEFTQVAYEFGATTNTSQLDTDDSTSVQQAFTNGSGSALNFDVNLIAPPDEEFARNFYAVFPTLKIESSPDETSWFATATASGVTSSTLIGDPGAAPDTDPSFNNWTGADDDIHFGFSANEATGFVTAADGFTVRLRASIANGDSIDVDTYGGELDVWYELPWEQYWRRIFAKDMKGVSDVTYERNSTDYLYNPADVFAWFVTEVLGTTASGWEDASDDMDADGLRVDFQFTDVGETGEDFLERLATQSMSWIVPDDAGGEKIIYRRTAEPTVARAEDPITKSDIIKGSFNWGLTPREDIYRGVTVNYAYNALLGDYDEQYHISPSSASPQTNVDSDASLYTDFADTIQDVNARRLEVDADLIRDGATAERLCKWLTLLHGRRRQMIEFDVPVEFAWITPGDVIYVNMPQVRSFCEGDELQFSGTIIGVGSDIIESTSTTFEPSAAGLGGLEAAHQNDLLVIDSGTYAGTYRLRWESALWSLPGHTAFDAISGTQTISSSWRVLPPFDVLSAQFVFDGDFGPRMHIKAVEHPVLLPLREDL